jgi:succinyl-CoA synthetase beta subunit
VDIAKEYYLSCLVDRSKKRIVFIGSSEGGMDIEEVAAKTPEKILTIAIDPIAGIQPYQCRTSASRWDGQGRSRPTGQGHDRRLQHCSCKRLQPGRDQPADRDPGSGQVMALDAKVSLDDNALYRHRTPPSCAIPLRKTSASTSPTKSASTMWRWMATSAAWSTAPVWRWRPWM